MTAKKFRNINDFITAKKFV